MPKYLLGKEFTVSYNNLTMGVATSYGLNINKSMVETTTMLSAGWKDQYPDIKDWSVDFDGLVSRTVGDASIGFDYLVASIKTDASVGISLTPNALTNKYESGVGYITKLSMKGGKDGVVTFSGTVTGTGALATMTTPAI